MRTVIFNHNLFKEGMECFHPVSGKEHYKPLPTTKVEPERLYGYLAFDFKLAEDWDFGDFVIEKSIEVCHNCKDTIGQECVKSFVSPILMPEWVSNQFFLSHLFLLGLSAVCSFCLDRPVYSPRNSFLVAKENRVPIQFYLNKNKGDGEFIENYKAVIITSDGDEIYGTFRYPPHIPEAHRQLPLSIRISDTENINIEIYDEDSLGEITGKQTNIEIKSIFVIQHPDLKVFHFHIQP